MISNPIDLVHVILVLPTVVDGANKCSISAHSACSEVSGVSAFRRHCCLSEGHSLHIYQGHGVGALG